LLRSGDRLATLVQRTATASVLTDEVPTVLFAFPYRDRGRGPGVFTRQLRGVPSSNLRPHAAHFRSSDWSSDVHRLTPYLMPKSPIRASRAWSLRIADCARALTPYNLTAAATADNGVFGSVRSMKTEVLSRCADRTIDLGRLCQHPRSSGLRPATWCNGTPTDDTDGIEPQRYRPILRGMADASG